jgi:hypothetical protein
MPAGALLDTSFSITLAGHRDFGEQLGQSGTGQ